MSGRAGTFDVIAARLDTKEVRLLAEGKAKNDAEAIVEMAVLRRGVDVEFFDVVPTGTYKEGDRL